MTCASCPGHLSSDLVRRIRRWVMLFVPASETRALEGPTRHGVPAWWVCEIKSRPWVAPWCWLALPARGRPCSSIFLSARVTTPWSL